MVMDKGNKDKFDIYILVTNKALPTTLFAFHMDWNFFRPTIWNFVYQNVLVTSQNRFLLQSEKTSKCELS